MEETVTGGGAALRVFYKKKLYVLGLSKPERLSLRRSRVNTLILSCLIDSHRSDSMLACLVKHSVLESEQALGSVCSRLVIMECCTATMRYEEREGRTRVQEREKPFLV